MNWEFPRWDDEGVADPEEARRVVRQFLSDNAAAGVPTVVEHTGSAARLHPGVWFRIGGKRTPVFRSPTGAAQAALEEVSTGRPFGEMIHVAQACATCIRCGQGIVPGQEIVGEHGVRHHAGANLPACEAEQMRHAARIAASADPQSDGRHTDSVRYGNVR